jgi:hypothetical protein
MMIDCGRCDMRGVACQDCVVAVIAPPGTTRHLEAEEMRALGVLADAGMIPPLRPNVTSATAPASRPVLGAVRMPRTWAFPATKAS